MTTESLTETLQETLSLFDASGTPMTTSEVAERLDLGRRSTYDRLDRLAEADRLQTKKVGASARVWWRVPPAPSIDALESNPDAFSVGSILRNVLDGSEIGVFVLDSAFDVAWVNETAAEYFDLVPSEAIGRDKATLIRESIASQFAEPAAFADRVLATYEDNTYPESFECQQVVGDGENRWLEHQSRPIEHGEYAGGRIELYYDVTERRLAEDERKVERTQLHSLIDAVEEYAIFRLDVDGHVRSWNTGAERIKGYSQAEILGEHFSTFYSDEDVAAGVPEANLEAARDRGMVEDEGWRVRADGSTFWADVTIRAVYDDDGRIEGFVKITRDMTERREREQELRRERDLTEQLLETAPIRLAIFDGEGKLLRINSESRRALGISDDDRSTFDVSHLEFYSPDGERLDATDHPVMQVIETGEPASRDVKHVGPDGEQRWVTLRANPLYGDDGELKRVVIAGQDFTERKRSEMQLERQRDELSAELDEMFERVDDAFFALDDDWRFTYVNEQAAEMLERSVGELMGQNVWAAFPEARGSTFEEEYERALETQETRVFVEYYPPLERWIEVTAYPSESGLSVYFRDVTDRTRRENELERYETIVDTMSDGVYVIDESGTITMVNDAYAEMLGYEPSELVGMHASDIVGEHVSDRAKELHRQLRTGERAEARLEAELVRADGETFIAEATFALIGSARGPTERVGVVRDMTERRARERRLERYETIVETVGDGIYAVDGEGRFMLVNQSFCDITGYDRSELIGAPATILYDDSQTPTIESRAEAVAAGEYGVANIQIDIERKSGEVVPCETLFTPVDLADDGGRCGVVRDISDRLEQERELERRLTQQEVVATLGERALEDHDVDALMDEAARLVAETLDMDYCKVLDLDPGDETLLLRQGVGWQDGIVGEARVSAVEAESQASYTLAVDEPVVVEDLTTEARFSGPDLLRDHDVHSGISTIIGSVDAPWGILGTHDRGEKQFSETDVNFVQSVANILATAINRHEDEAELRRQRELLAALNSLNGVVRETTRAIMEQPTRERIESTVCENLAASESYEFAWIGEADRRTDDVVVRTSAGADGYLDDITITTDPEDPEGAGPTGRAIRERTPQVARNLLERESHSPWQDRAEAAGVQSSAAIPIVHEESVYGVLNVYSARPDAFQKDELSVIGQLGEVVGHAIAATQRKRALLSDEVVELEFAIRDVFDQVEGVTAPPGTIDIAQAVPLEDGEFLLFGSASEDAAEALPDFVEHMPYWTDVAVREAGERWNFEIRLKDPPLLTTLASVGGKIVSAHLEDGSYQLTIHLSPNTEVRRVVEAITEEYPTASLLRRRQKTRADDQMSTVEQTLAAELTDRQRTAIEAAYHSGFFEWPRDVNGEALADSLGVTPPTFHQHLRKAERKLLEAVLTDSTLEE